MTEVAFNYGVLVSTEEIRGYVVNAWCIQNQRGLFSSTFEKISDHWAALYTTVCFRINFFSPTLSAAVCACVYPSIVCCHVCVYIICLRTCFNMRFWLWSPRAMQPRCIFSRVPNQLAKREPDIVCSTMWLTPARLPEEAAICPWLAITHWECTLKTYESTFPLGAKLNKW